LDLKNPIVVSSSGLTNSVEKIKKIEEMGAGAVVLKSLFEEQIDFEAGSLMNDDDSYPEAGDYISNYVKNTSVEKYLDLIKDAKKAVNIPIIASINCISAKDWTSFAKRIEEAGADALELNIYVVAMNKNMTSADYEQIYYDIVEEVSKRISIPIAVKLSYHFTNFVNMIDRLSVTGASGVVLFNRFYQPDIDIDKMQVTAADVFSTPSDIRHSLRWVAIVSDKIRNIDISASTGVHDGEGAVKMLLAGANTVQVCSVLYEKGVEHIQTILKDIETWMDKKGFKELDDFRAKMSARKLTNPARYQRAQFMKYFSSHE
jgi:dihydroorotate dehydrogenase (fumarate)